MSFLKKWFESEEEEKKRLELERRRQRRAEEAAEAEGIEFPRVIYHNAEGHARADAAEDAVAAAREQARAARAARAAEKAARAAEIAAEIPEAQEAIAALTEYREKLGAHQEIHAPGGYYPTADLFYARPHDNIDKVYEACSAASAAYKALGNMEKSKEYAKYASEIYDESRMNYMGGGKKTRYSRKMKSISKYSRKSKSKYSRKSKSKYSRKSKSKLKSKYSRK